MYGVADGVLPDFRSADQGAIDNERSLLYVAVTRALTAMVVPRTALRSAGAEDVRGSESVPGTSKHARADEARWRVVWRCALPYAAGTDAAVFDSSDVDPVPD